ncbi:hypothetical protein P5G65_29050 [Paenibacillus chondroitinus]|uniref:Uncharacterized protein n=1 Tax=Paenibacillus chondroitinus TaxID=59842 RepID=A0ABU6DLW7_9BACL|nr:MULTISPECIES: hypothetical protein [Paenibacillus]MCY9660983.1 hypothetical protein [Paenibacillus anseongense]MEB4797958.1 hypothetical protein [Paenibacillus chondroitinus]
MSNEKLALDVIFETSVWVLSLIPGAEIIVDPVKSVVSDYVIIQLSKREEFRDNTYWIKRNKREYVKINLLHYDNLYGYAVDIKEMSTH